MLEKTNPEEGYAFSRLQISAGNSGSSCVFLRDGFHGCWYAGDCMSLAGLNLAHFVHAAAPKEMEFFNENFKRHAERDNWSSRGSRVGLVRRPSKEDKKKKLVSHQPELKYAPITSQPTSQRDDAKRLTSSPPTHPVVLSIRPDMPDSFWVSCSRSKTATFIVLPPISIFTALVSAEATLSLLEKSTTSLLDNCPENIKIAIAVLAGITSLATAIVEIYLATHKENTASDAIHPAFH
jgi:hypothetical protein